MNFIFFFLLVIFQGCTNLPELYKTIDDIATDNAITVTCDRDCFKRNTDVKICVDVVTND